MTIQSQLEELLDCVCAELATVGWEGECCLAPGEPALDTCCESDAGEGAGQQAWARLVAIRRPQTEGAALQPIDAGLDPRWELVVEVGASICVCDDMCNCEQRGYNAETVLAAAEVALRGVSCCQTCAACGSPDVVDLTVGGPQGACSVLLLSAVLTYSAGCP